MVEFDGGIGCEVRLLSKRSASVSDIALEDAAMIGWWEEGVPVTTNKTDVLVTVYRKDEKSLVSIASWPKQTERILLKIDWQKLGIDSRRVKCTAPELDGLQNFSSFTPDQTISVQPEKGYLLLFEQS